MKRLIFILLGFLLAFQGYTQNGDPQIFDLGVIDELSAEQQKKINAALAVADAVEKAGAYIKSLSDLVTTGEFTLPVGIKKSNYSLIIQKIVGNDQKGNPIVQASCAFRFKDTGQVIAFEGQATLEGKKGLETSGKLQLVAPIRQNLGKESAVIIREGTTVNFGCEGVESFDARMTWIVTSPTIIPVHADGSPTNTPLSADFQARFQHFDNYLISLNINKSFCIKGLNDVIFTLRGATLDQSESETSLMTQFPRNYLSPAGADAVKLWKGVSISEATVSLPSFFKHPSSGGNGRISVSLQQVLFDENGFTGNVDLKNIIQSQSLNPESWGISLHDFSLSVLKNRIEAFGFGGDMNIPPFGKHSLLPYTARINPATGEYDFKVNLAGQYDFPVLRSTLSLNELSTLEVSFKDSDIYPVIRASGKLSVNVPLGNDTSLHQRGVS